jgi:hypothetical protein
MKVQRRSQLTGIVHTLDIPCTEEEWRAWKYEGKHIQDAMPNVPAPLREFCISGVTPDEWEEHMKDPPEDEYGGSEGPY